MLKTQLEILDLVSAAELAAIHFKPEEHPFGALHLIWSLRDAINSYFALPEESRAQFVHRVRVMGKTTPPSA